MPLGIEEIFAPGLARWQEYLETERLRRDVKPTLGPGPTQGPVKIDHRTGAVVIDSAALEHEEDVRQQRRDGLA